MSNETEKAWDIIANTGCSMFLTGRAGTGKTTFLRNLYEKLPKRMVVLAPTGVAAINARGATLHSFFQLPFGPNVPGRKHKAESFQIKKKKKKIIAALDLVVIDEISMVRADTLDAVDEVLRRVRHSSRPFGGVQMLFIGDMQQLPPVAKDEEWQLLSPYYETPYFFSSRALQRTDYVTIELTHVYRQTDAKFLELLNKVRENSLSADTIEELNKRYVPNFQPAEGERYIRLTTHNAQADAINRQELAALTTPLFKFNAQISGEFQESFFPTVKQLELKKGAQVMFIKNDSSAKKRFYNGMLGEVVELDKDKICVKPNEADECIKVELDTWENVKYDIDKKTREITENVVGTFKQYPLKPAWAITIHKSQGLTFSHAIIDVHRSFAHGQAYVALSRCKSLEGMVLSAPLSFSSVISDDKVRLFAEDPRHQPPSEQRFGEMQRQYALDCLVSLFEIESLCQAVYDFNRAMREHVYGSQPKLCGAWAEAYVKLGNIEDVSEKFYQQYSRLVYSVEKCPDDAFLQERIKKGAAYFLGELAFIKPLLGKTDFKNKSDSALEHLGECFQTVKEIYELKQHLYKYVESKGFNVQNFLKFKGKALLIK